MDRTPAPEPRAYTVTAAFRRYESATANIRAPDVERACAEAIAALDDDFDLWDLGERDGQTFIDTVECDGRRIDVPLRFAERPSALALANVERERDEQRNNALAGVLNDITELSLAHVHLSADEHANAIVVAGLTHHDAQSVLQAARERYDLEFQSPWTLDGDALEPHRYRLRALHTAQIIVDIEGTCEKGLLPPTRASAHGNNAEDTAYLPLSDAQREHAHWLARALHARS